MQNDQQPNILFILVDDTGYSGYGAFFPNQRQQAGDPSEPWHFTPRLDRLAEEGVQLPPTVLPAEHR